MFTGIITDIGTIDKIEQRADLRIWVNTAYDMATVDLGASIACSGICLTVVDKGPGWFAADLSAETISRSAADRWQAGNRLNLERALKVGDELGGHIVTGHVDAVGAVLSVKAEGGSSRLQFAMPDSIAGHVASKGSITVDGVSLTVNEVEDLAEGSLFGVNIIPHTADHTTLGGLEAGDQINLEIDVLSRYLSRLTAFREGK